MKTNRMLYAICVALVTLTLSCKKYDDGPRLSLRTKTARVANDWQFDKVTAPNGQDLTSSFADNSIELDKDGKYTERYDMTSINGTWRFASDKEDIILTPNDNSNAITLHILRLKEREFWFTNDFGSGVYEYHLSQK